MLFCIKRGANFFIIYNIVYNIKHNICFDEFNQTIWEEEMKKTKQSFMTVLLVVVLIISLVGCGEKEAEEAKEATAEENTTETANSDNSEAMEDIEFWSVFTGPDGENMTAMVEEYNATNPKVKVVHRPIEAGDFYTKLPTMVATGSDIPDLSIVHVERLPLFVEQGLLTELDDYLAANGNIKAEDYVPVAWEKGNVDGKQYAVPLDVHSFITYYNKDLLEQYGPNVLDDGAITFEEVEAVSKLAKEDGITGMGITWMRVKAMAWYAQLGGKLSENGIDPTINNDKFAKVMNTVKDLHDNGYTSLDGEDPIQLFQSGQMVFLPEGIWMKNSLTLVDTLNFGMTQTIQFDPKIKGNWTSSHQMVILDNPNMTDERAAAVLAFVEWVGENSIEWARAGQNPASLKILDNEEFKSMGQAFLLEETDSLIIHDYKYYGFAAEAIDKFCWDIPFGKVSVEEGLSSAEKEIADRIKELN